MNEMTVSATVPATSFNQAIYDAGYQQGVADERGRIVGLLRYWNDSSRPWPPNTPRTFAGALQFLLKIFVS